MLKAGGLTLQQDSHHAILISSNRNNWMMWGIVFIGLCMLLADMTYIFSNIPVSKN